MVSQQATKSPRARGLLSHQICNDFIGRGASVDIIAYKNEFVLSVACALPAEVKEGPELFKATVDVAYCESETLSHAVSPAAHVGGTEIKSRKIKTSLLRTFSQITNEGALPCRRSSVSAR
jgi:hypothetical protein